MLDFNTLLIPILGGFVFVKLSYITSFRSVRDNGYVILFKSAAIGLSFYALAFFVWRSAILNEEAEIELTETIEFVHKFLGDPTLLPAILSLVFIVFIILFGNIFWFYGKPCGYRSNFPK
jgi:hypothetical protein